jgi:hypothetical protein
VRNTRRMPRSRSRLLYDWWSISQHVLVSSTLVGLATRYYFSKVEVTLRLTVNQSACLGIEHPCGTCDQILLPVGMLLSEIYGLVSVGRPLWREDRSAVCSAITQWSESRRTRNHTLLSHPRLPQPGRSSCHTLSHLSFFVAAGLPNQRFDLHRLY